MGFKDQREWLSKLESEGELKRINTEVDWNNEIGAFASSRSLRLDIVGAGSTCHLLWLCSCGNTKPRGEQSLCSLGSP